MLANSLNEPCSPTGPKIMIHTEYNECKLYFFFLSCDCIITLEPNFFFFLHQRIGYPLQYSWASLVAQLVTNPSAMPETWVRSLGWEDRLEKGKATHSSIPAWRIPWMV